MRAAVVDTETTGIDESARVVELASAHLATGKFYTTLVDPQCPIPPEAMAVHHITDQEVVGQPLLAAAIDLCQLTPTHVDVLVAHNASFDSRMLSNLPQPWICTYKCALRLWPDASSHSLQVLRYIHKLTPLFPQDAGLTPHRALYDVICTVQLLALIQSQLSMEEMIAISAAPALLPRIRFGKHRGMAFSDVPTSYLTWLRNQDGNDEDLSHTVSYHLKLRAA
jgi:exodeoxyribonuclease X